MKNINNIASRAPYILRNIIIENYRKNNPVVCKEYSYDYYGEPKEDGSILLGIRCTVCNASPDERFIKKYRKQQRNHEKFKECLNDIWSNK